MMLSRANQNSQRKKLFKILGLEKNECKFIRSNLVSKKKFKNNLLENWEFKTQNNDKIPAYFIKPKDKKFVVAGGVAANKEIRNMLIKLCEEKNYEPIFPPIDLCGDNAAMIAMVGLEKFKLNQFNKLDYPAKPRWPLDEDAVFLKGAGVQL